MIGKISTLDLNDSQVKKDQSRKEYVQELYYYWYYFYQLRSITLYDYLRHAPLSIDFEKAIKGV